MWLPSHCFIILLIIFNKLWEHFRNEVILTSVQLFYSTQCLKCDITPEQSVFCVVKPHSHSVGCALPVWRLLISLPFAYCFLLWAWGNFLSVCSISFVPFSTVLCEGGGHRKITIIIEDPVAGWQCSFTVLHLFLDPTRPPPLALFFSAWWQMTSIPSHFQGS